MKFSLSFCTVPLNRFSQCVKVNPNTGAGGALHSKASSFVAVHSRLLHTTHTQTQQNSTGSAPLKKDGDTKDKTKDEESIAIPLLSSTILMCAPVNPSSLCPSSQTSSPFDYAIFFVKRHGKSRFMPDTYVFPGGVMEQVDREKAMWATPCHSGDGDLGDDITDTNGNQTHSRSLSDMTETKAFTKEMQSACLLLDKEARLGIPPKTEKKDAEVKASPWMSNSGAFVTHPRETDTLWSLPLSFRLTAIREAFEETGILLAEANCAASTADGLEEKNIYAPIAAMVGEEGEYQSFRDMAHRDPRIFPQMCAKLGMLPAVNNLYPWSRWITPKALKYRYNTMFYLAFLKEIPEHALHDENETTASCWLSPDEALAQFEKGEILVPHTTWYNMKYLVDKKLHTLSSLHAYVSETLPAEENAYKPIRPFLSMSKGGSYPVTADGNESKRKAKSKGQQITTGIKIVRLPGDKEHPDYPGNADDIHRIEVTGPGENPVYTLKHSFELKSP
eukprot:Nk52_evm16s2118 gene=Nk52_evmTU16s2118